MKLSLTCSCVNLTQKHLIYYHTCLSFCYWVSDQDLLTKNIRIHYKTSIHSSIIIHTENTIMKGKLLLSNGLCAGCFQPFYGELYSCMVCPNYYICSECKEERKIHNQHKMIDVDDSVMHYFGEKLQHYCIVHEIIGYL